MYDVTLHADVLRTIGYAAACPCEWVGSFRKVYAQAQDDARGHNAAHREKSPDAA